MEHIEGRQSILAALAAWQRKFQVILIRHGVHAELIGEVLQLAAARGVPVRRVDRSEIDALAHGSTHGGLVAICTPKPRMTADELLEMIASLRKPPLLLLLEGVEDARNLGFTLRTADAMGVHAVLIKKHLWDFDPVEIARPASGAYERVALVQIDDVSVVHRLSKHGVRIIGCLARARHSIQNCDLAGAVLLAVGGEKRGLSGAMRGLCDSFAAIPTLGGATSLSLSHACAIVLWESMRQRLTNGVNHGSGPAAQCHDSPASKSFQV